MRAFVWWSSSSCFSETIDPIKWEASVKVFSLAVAACTYPYRVSIHAMKPEVSNRGAAIVEPIMDGLWWMGEYLFSDFWYLEVMRRWADQARNT